MEPILFGAARAADGDRDSGGQWRTDFVFEFFAGGHAGGPAGRGPYCHHMIMAPNNTCVPTPRNTQTCYVLTPAPKMEPFLRLT
jgi:hypothetical protein